MILSNLKFAAFFMAITAITAMTSPADNAVTITIISPVENSKINMGDTVHIKANVTSENALHDVSIKVKTADNTLVLFSEIIHTHSNQQAIDKSYIQTIKYKTELVLEISTKDHSGNVIATSSRKFYSNKK